jgi:hypothetical protein
MCGKSYKPSMPFRLGQKFGFCSRKCKDQFHTRGAGYTKARDQISKEINRQMRIYMKCDECHARPRRTPCAKCQATGWLLTDYGNYLRDFVKRSIADAIRLHEQLWGINLNAQTKIKKGA